MPNPMPRKHQIQERVHVRNDKSHGRERLENTQTQSAKCCQAREQQRGSWPAVATARASQLASLNKDQRVCTCVHQSSHKGGGGRAKAHEHEAQDHEHVINGGSPQPRCRSVAWCRPGRERERGRRSVSVAGHARAGYRSTGRAGVEVCSGGAARTWLPAEKVKLTATST